MASPKKDHNENYLKLELYERIQSDHTIFDFLHEGSLDGIWYWDLTQQDQEWMSPRFWEVLGYDYREKKHLSSEWQDLIFEEDLKKAAYNLEEHIKNPDHPYDQTVRYRHKDGSTIWIRCRGLAIRDENGKAIRMIGAHTNLTSLKNTEALLTKKIQELQLIQQLNLDFISNVSHEIRTPMNGIYGMLTILKSEKEPQFSEEKLDTMINSCESLIQFLEDIFHFSRLSHNKVELDQAPFNLKETANDVCEILKSLPLLKGKSISIQFNYVDEKKQFFIGDKNKIKQIIINLMNNAIKFTNHGQINLTIKPATDTSKEDAVLIEVKDSGIGIPNDKISSIFTEYSQVDDSMTKSSGGIGLGLSIIQQLVELMKGTVDVQSVERKGSTFTVSLPLEPTKPIETIELANISKLERLRGKILVVEDNLVNQKIMIGLLSGTNIECDIANHGAEALDMIKSQKYDLILMDIYMPVMDGITATKHIRISDNETPIIAVTAGEMENEKKKFLQYMNGFISKPIKKIELLKALQDHLPKSE